jgi:hypothetical protein
VPRLSYFYGIAIYIYWDDHNPPHYHAVYGEHEAWIVIAGASVLHGWLPTRALRLVALGTGRISTNWMLPGNWPRRTRPPIP